MTVETTTTIAGPYPTNGVATAFPFSFRALSADEVQVVREVGGVETTVSPSLYKVQLSAQSGTVVFDAPPAAGANIYVLSDPDFKQNISFSNQSAFLPSSHNEANDRSAIRAQVLAEQVKRAPVLPLDPSKAAGLFPKVLADGSWGYEAAGPGATGPANSTYTSLASLKAAPQSNRSYILADGTHSPVTYAYVAGDFTGRADDVNVVKLNTVPLTTGALVRQQTDSVSYRAPAVAAQTQSQSQKNQQTVDFFDALTPAMRASVNSGNLAVDCSPALNAITTFAYGGESQGDATGGTTLYIKGGRYRLNDPIKNTYRRDNQIIDNGDLRRLNIQGDGTNNTALFYFGPAGFPAIETAGYRGTTNNDGVALRQKISGIWLRRWPIASKTGIGMRISHAEGMMLDDVIIDGFEVNMFATDVLEFFAHQLFLKDCAIGVRMTLSDFTNPNVVRFDGGGVSGASVQGMHFVRPANVILDTVRFEGNGFDENFQLILAELGTPEGGFSLGVYNCYMEGNMGAASLTLAHGFASDAMVDFQRNTVHNDGATRFMQHHIDYARFAAADAAGSNCVINHGPQRYRNLGAYVSSPSRSAVRIQTPGALLVEHAGNKYPSDNERPETNGFPTVGLMYDVMGASVFADGSYTADFNINPNVLRVEHPSTGVYRVFYRTAPRVPGAVIATASLASASGSATIFDRTATYVQVQTYAPNGDPADRAFTLAVKGSFA